MTDLNRTGRSNAQAKITAGDVDKTSAWSFSAADGNDLLGGADGSDWANYGKWFLGTDSQENFDTKNHWKYPFGKGGKVYRSALIAIRDRAGQQKDHDIYAAAGSLLDEIDGTTDRTHENRAAVDNTIRVENRPPKIEILPPRGDFASAPPSTKMLEEWKAGIRAATTPDGIVIQMFDVIGYDCWTGGGITADSVSDSLKAAGGDPVTVQINSPGGDMFEGIAIYEVLRQYSGEVTMQVLGLAASAASVIAMAGDKIEIGQAAFLMIHNCWVIAMGNQNDFRDLADYLEPFDSALCGVYAARSGQKASDISGWMNDERYINAADAVKLGFADSILSRSAVKEDKAATEAAAQFNSVRKVESMLTKKSGMTRAAARALIQDIKGGTQDAAARDGRKPGAAETTRDAGQWLGDAQALLDTLRK
jgi:ATP-dependent Clp protease, protease subunit